MVRTAASAAACCATLAATAATASADEWGHDPHRGGHDGDGARVVQDPVISGTVRVGSRLTATARWTGSYPIEVNWRWIRCADTDLRSCEFIDGADDAAYTPVAGDLGRRLRVLLVVGNRDGYDYGYSGPTAPVAAAPPPPPVTPPPPVVSTPIAPPPSVPAPPAMPSPPVEPLTPHHEKRHHKRSHKRSHHRKRHHNRRLRMMRPKPVVRISGWLMRDGAWVRRLTVRAPRGAHIRVRCKGRGCPRHRWAHLTGLVHIRPFERLMLRAGVRLTITVTKRGRVGKHTVIVLRRHERPWRRDRCVYPGSHRVIRCPR